MAAPKTATPKDNNRPEIEMGLLPNLMGFNLRCAQLTLFQHFGATVGKEGISAPQFGTLLLIEANPDISQSAVAEALRFDRSTLVQIIDRLEARDLVVRHVSPTDRRSHALRLTVKGETELANLKGLAVQHEADVAAALSEAERAQLIALLAKLHGG